jgi:hypothetical protein
MTNNAATTEVRRGSFTKDGIEYEVYASSANAPESMRVYRADDRNSLVLVVSGLNSGDLKPSWGPPWAEFASEWRDEFEENAYRAYVSRVAIARSSSRVTGVARVCNG